MNQKTDQTVAHPAADLVDNPADRIKSAADVVGGTVRNAAHKVHEVASGARNTCEEAGQFAPSSFKRGRARVRSWETSFESYVRHKPKTCLLVAASLGACIGASIWKRK